MSQRCQVITRRLTRKVNPVQVIEAIYDCLKEFRLEYTNCLWELSCSILEYTEDDGKFHSNRKTNGIERILKQYPQLVEYKTTKIKNDKEDIQITNFDFYNSYLPNDNNCFESCIVEVLGQVPKPFSLSDINFIVDGVTFRNKQISELTQTDSTFPKLFGSYIWYYRTVYGDEKHSYISIATEFDDFYENLNVFRQFHFAIAEKLPSKYLGTEILTME